MTKTRTRIPLRRRVAPPKGRAGVDARPRGIAPLLAALLLTTLSGCGQAYHCYSGCGVDCRYCPLPPLPVVCYDPCVCHSYPAVQQLEKPTHASPAPPLDSVAPTN